MIFTKDELPVAAFSLIGVNLQDAAQLPSSELELLLQGRLTNVLKFKPALEGIDKHVSLGARLSLFRDILGKAILKFHPRNIELVNSFGLTPSQIQELKAHPDVPVMVVHDEKSFGVFISIPGQMKW